MVRQQTVEGPGRYERRLKKNTKEVVQNESGAKNDITNFLDLKLGRKYLFAKQYFLSLNIIKPTITHFPTASRILG